MGAVDPTGTLRHADVPRQGGVAVRSLLPSGLDSLVEDPQLPLVLVHAAPPSARDLSSPPPRYSDTPAGLRYRSSHPSISSHQMKAFWGLRTQCPSSGK